MFTDKITEKDIRRARTFSDSPDQWAKSLVYKLRDDDRRPPISKIVNAILERSLDVTALDIALAGFDKETIIEILTAHSSKEDGELSAIATLTVFLSRVHSEDLGYDLVDSLCSREGKVIEKIKELIGREGLVDICKRLEDSASAIANEFLLLIQKLYNVKPSDQIGFILSRHEESHSKFELSKPCAVDSLLLLSNPLNNRHPPKQPDYAIMAF